MPYNNVISRTDAAALIPEDVANQIIQEMPPQSAALSTFRQVRMARAQQRLPVMSALAVAYWVSPTDTGLKQTSEVNWSNVYLNAEEIACIVPIPQAVLDDSAFDIWANVRPILVAAIGRTLDAAVFFGTNIPGTWPTAVVPAAVAAGNTVTVGAAAASGGLAADYVTTFSKVWEDGFDVNFALAPPQAQAALYNARDAQGRRLDDIQPTADGDVMIAGVPVEFTMGGLWPVGAAAAIQISGDQNQGIIGIRQDITYKLLTEAVIQDNTGAIVYNLAQQDMVAMRVVFRVAFAVPNPITYDQPAAGSRYPFAVLRTT
jgi:HK97 family phage major capsid protein